MGLLRLALPAALGSEPVPLSIGAVQKNADAVGRYEKLELTVSIEGLQFENPYNPEEVDLSAEVPSARSLGADWLQLDRYAFKGLGPMGEAGLKTAGLPSTALYGMRSAAFSFFYLPAATPGAQFQLPRMDPGAYRVEWWDIRTGKVLAAKSETAGAQGVPLEVPPSEKDIACKLWKEGTGK